MAKKLWWQKYRPKTIDDFIFSDESLKKVIRKYIDEKNIPHLLFYGPRGTGKTTLAHILINSIVDEDHISSDVLYINGSKDGGIDQIRTQITSHISTVPMGELKIVFVDEADGLSSSAQDSLRGVLEKYDGHARVIFTCNYQNRLTPELRSRFKQIRFSPPDKESIMLYCAKILTKEGVDLEDDENLQAFSSIMEEYAGDLRQIVITLENSVYDGKIHNITIDDASLEAKMDIFDKISQDNWMEARRIAAENFTDDELIEVYRFLYDYLKDIPKFEDSERFKKGVVIISDHMFRHALHPDQEINFASCLIRLSEV